MKEPEEGLGSTDFYLLSKLGVVRSISKDYGTSHPSTGAICSCTGPPTFNILPMLGESL